MQWAGAMGATDASNSTRFIVGVGVDAGAMGAAGAISVVGAGAICSEGAMSAALGFNNEAYITYV